MGKDMPNCWYLLRRLFARNSCEIATSTLLALLRLALSTIAATSGASALSTSTSLLPAPSCGATCSTMYTGWIDGDIDGSVALSGDAGFDGDGVGVLCAACIAWLEAWLAATALAQERRSWRSAGEESSQKTA